MKMQNNIINRKTSRAILTMFLLTIVIYSVKAHPYTDTIPFIPTEFYGTVTWYDVNSTPFPVGTKVDSYAGSQWCGTFYIVNQGYYGLLSCNADDLDTNVTEGAIQGQNILFRIENGTTLAIGDTVWYRGEFHRVDIYPEPHCGNGHCELTESCITCPEDCGVCPPEGPGEGTGGEGGEGGGGGGGAGGGGAAGGAGLVGREVSMQVCQEDWICTDWFPEVCPINETQTRICIDRNNCGTEYNKPDATRKCQYLGTCFDFFVNQDETDIDCGGLICQPCDIGKHCLFDTDCKSGFCHPIEEVCRLPTCDDGFKNQGEEDIDCGGPCPPCPMPPLRIEQPGAILNFLLIGCGPFPWIFVLVSSMLLLIIYLFYNYYIQKIQETKKFKKLTKLEQLQRLYSMKRNLNMLVLIGIVLMGAIALYFYYLCQVIVWMFILILLIIPLLAAVIIKYLVYDEKRKQLKMKLLLHTHEEQLRRIIQLEKEEVSRLRQNLIPKIQKQLESKKLDKSVQNPLEKILKVLQSLESDNPIEEKKAIDEIEAIKKEEITNKFNTIDLRQIYDSLLLIQRIYDDKNKLREQLKQDIEIEHKLEESKVVTEKFKEDEIPLIHKEEKPEVGDNKEEEFIDSEIQEIKKRAVKNESIFKKLLLRKKKDEETETKKEIPGAVTPQQDSSTEANKQPAKEANKGDTVDKEASTGEEVVHRDKIDELVEEYNNYSKSNGENGKEEHVDTEQGKNFIVQKAAKQLEKEREEENLSEKKEEHHVNLIDFTKVCPPDKYFILHNGVMLKSIKELYQELKIINEDVFNHHVNAQKNDFATWLKDVFEEQELAEALRNTKSKKEMMEVLEKYRKVE